MDMGDCKVIGAFQMILKGMTREGLDSTMCLTVTLVELPTLKPY